jgi:hypothetical protein
MSSYHFNEVANFELFDISGKSILKEMNTAKDQFTLKMEGLPAGLYIFKVYDDTTPIGVGKIIIQ